MGHPVDIRISIIRFGKLASSPVWEDVCEGEESDGDEDEGGVPGDQSADQVAVHCTAHQYTPVQEVRLRATPQISLTGLSWINFLCNNRTNYLSKKSHTLLSCWPGFSSRFAVRRMWRLRIFPAITQMTCINKIPNTIYREFQLLLFPAGTPPQGKILFLSPKIRFLVYFLNLQNKG